MNLELINKLRNIKLIIMDVDGTLTDGTIIIDSRGIETKHFNVKDGMGIALAHQAGLKTGIISARESEVVTIRSKELDISFVKQGAKDKIKALIDMVEESGLTKEQSVFIGDDINDIKVCEAVGVSFAVCDAADRLKDIVDHVLSCCGGKGAVREAIELIIKYNTLEPR